MSEHILHVTDGTFESEVINAAGPVLVDYWAEWCGPCKMIAPILDELADEYGSKIRVAKLNIDENPVTTGKYKVRGIPTMMIFSGGEIQGMKVGALTKGALKSFIDETIYRLGLAEPRRRL